MSESQSKIKGDINFYVVAGLFVIGLAFLVGNAFEPDIAEELDFFEVILTLVYAVAAAFAFNVARRYRGSQIFGRAYFALGIAFASYFIGWVLWFVFQVWLNVSNPYPSYPDVAYFLFYPFSIYHLRTNIHYFKRKLDKRQLFTLFSIPSTVFLIYLVLGLFPVDASEGVFALKINPHPGYEPDFVNQFIGGLVYVFMTTLVFSYSLIGVQTFRGTVLGTAWGLLMVAFALNAAADLPYYFAELVGSYERPSMITGLWFSSMIIACYALYKHRDL
jgi:hypothetical protein